MRDLPTGLDLMALARCLLLEEILPLVPETRRPDLHLAATAMAVAAREATNGDAPLREIAELLAAFYDDPHPPALRAGLTLSRNAEEGVGRGKAGEGGLAPLLRRLAADLRRGGFETSRSREQAARAILWRLTVLKLREGNPQFLAAHGIV